MRLSVMTLLLVIVSLFPQSILAASGNRANHLFFIERSKNKNLVQYDVRLTENRNLPDLRPVNAYWILENGKHEELNSVEKDYAYGIARQQKLDKDKFKIILAAFKGLEIIVERMNDSFKALVPINGKESILQKIYIKSEETGALFPRVIYVDLFGQIKGTGLAIKERFIPNN